MIQRKLTSYLNEESRAVDRELIRKLRKFAEKYSIQYALLWYIYLRGGAGLLELHKVYRYLYRYLLGRVVRENTVRKQLRMLERKRLVNKVEGKYIALVDPRDADYVILLCDASICNYRIDSSANPIIELSDVNGNLVSAAEVPYTLYSMLNKLFKWMKTLKSYFLYMLLEVCSCG